jgi:hypothetical protein
MYQGRRKAGAEGVGGRYLFVWGRELINAKKRKQIHRGLRRQPLEIFSRNNQPKTCGCDQ